MPQPVPVSKYPDEILTRAYRVRRRLPGRFESPAVESGSVVYVRRSPFTNAPRSYWIENADGHLLAVVSEDMLRQDLTEIKKP